MILNMHVDILDGDCVLKLMAENYLITMTLTKTKRSDLFNILVECFKLKNDLESINSH